MERTQADAIAQAILEPDLRAQEEVRRERAIEAARLVQKRRVAWCTLIGFAAGAAAAYVIGERFTLGGIVGGLAGSALGWLLPRPAT